MKLPQWLMCLMGRHGPWAESPAVTIDKNSTVIYTGTICGPPPMECIHCGRGKSRETR